MSRYSSSRLSTLDTEPIPRKASLGRDSASLDAAPMSDSVLFLRIYAAADYFSLDKALMENVPPVAADIILDPFLANVFPRSLLPTAGWIVVVASVGFIVARWVVGEFRRVVNEERNEASDREEVKKEK
jgi:dUTPase